MVFGLCKQLAYIASYAGGSMRSVNFKTTHTSRHRLPPAGQIYRSRHTTPLNHRTLNNRTLYTMLGLLLVLASSCTVSQPNELAGKVDPNAIRGFKIQIHSTQDEGAAETFVSDAQNWWEAMDEQMQRNLFGVSYLPVEIKWKDPYYRVRIGYFESRDEARAVLKEIAGQFPAAFVVSDTMM